MENNNNNNLGKNDKYEESSGTGVLGGIIFLIVTIIFLFVLSKYI